MEIPRKRELDVLFERLADASSPAEAAPLEREIWAIWFEVGDPVLDRRMREGSLAMDRGDGDAALAAFDAVIATRPDFAEAWNRRATLYFLMRRFTESVADIERTLALEPRHFGALSGLALIREAQNEPFAALEALEQVCRIHPQMPHLLDRVEQLSSNLGEAS
jgi:tetratricopeptide (TPR) repeat protein